MCGGHTVIDELTVRAHVPGTRLWIEGDDWRGAAPTSDIRFAWSPDEGFRTR